MHFIKKENNYGNASKECSSNITEDILISEKIELFLILTKKLISKHNEGQKKRPGGLLLSS